MIHGIWIHDGKLEERDVDGELETYYDILGCRLIDIVSRRIGTKQFDIVCDDEGLFNNEAPISMIHENAMVPMLVGSLFICNSDKKGKLVSLSESDTQIIRAKWAHKVLLGLE